MSKIIVLGGCGAVGRIAVQTLATNDLIDELVIGDVNLDAARQIVEKDDTGKLTALSVNAMDYDSVSSAIKGCDLVLNCVGPFFKTVKTILSAVIDSGINYVDICDDVDVTLELLDMDQAAKDAGITALIGMGSSPGATNLLAKFAADTLLDETEAIDIFHAHGGEPIEGEGVIGHRFHCMSIDIPMFLEGRLTHVKYFEEDGIALRQTFDFPILGNNIQLYPYPHPEQVTLPRYINVRQVTNKGTVLPDAYYSLIADLCRVGMTSRDPLIVKGKSIEPYEFAVSYILRERERILEETQFGTQRGCCSVVVRGKKEGEGVTYRFHMASGSQALGEGTGIPAAMGVILMLQKKVNGTGVLPPEACVNPEDFIRLITDVMELDKKTKTDDSFSGVIVERVDRHGNITTLDI